jgi:hypothetical protein
VREGDLANHVHSALGRHITEGTVLALLCSGAEDF